MKSHDRERRPRIFVPPPRQQDRVAARRRFWLFVAAGLILLLGVAGMFVWFT